MDTRTRARVGIGLAIALGAVALAGLALSVVYGFAVEYGGGSFADLAFLVVPIPVVVAVLAVAVWPRVPGPTALAVVLGSLVVMAGGGLTVDALGQDEHWDRLVDDSRTFGCNGPHAELLLPAAVDQTWRELPRRSPIYGPLGGTPTSCTAGVAGDGDRAFAEYTAAFRDLEEWQVPQDGETRFVMTRDDVRVTVRRARRGQVSTIEVAVTR